MENDVGRHQYPNHSFYDLESKRLTTTYSLILPAFLLFTLLSLLRF